MDLPLSVHRPLPLEMNCEMYKFLPLIIQRKFIWVMGRGIYAMFRQKLLKKSKRLCNSAGNAWVKSNGYVTVSEDGLNARKNSIGWRDIYAKKGFPISVADCRMDDFPGTICYYFEVKTYTKRCVVGLLHGVTIFGICVGVGEFNRSSYTVSTISINGHFEDYQFSELPVGARAESNVQGNVYGCGILMDPDNILTTFFTLNGVLLGRQTPISPSVDRLIPAVSIWENLLTLEANFGDDKDKPFQYDIKKCPGLGLDGFLC